MFLKKLLVLFGITVFTISGSVAPASAEDSITKTFSGFAFEKPDLNLGMKSQIKAWVSAHSDYTVASCVGYTGQNVKQRSQAFLQKLATSRAKNICNFVKSINGGVSIYSTQGIPGNGKTAAARKVKVTLYKNTGGTGGGSVIVGVCDSSLTVTMRSRIATGDFYFQYMTIRGIATSCKGNVMDVYLLDKDGNELAYSADNLIEKNFLRISYSLFTPQAIQSNLIAKVAFEIRKN